MQIYASLERILKQNKPQIRMIFDFYLFQGKNMVFKEDLYN